VGAIETRKVDVRVIAATNRPLRAMIAEKQFREDLYYRLSMVEIKLPKVSERKTSHFLYNISSAALRRNTRRLSAGSPIVD